MDRVIGLTVEELKALLDNLPNKAYVVIGEDIIKGLVIVKGRAKSGYYNSSFQENIKGKHLAVKFTKHTEFSDGVVDLVKI